MCGCLNRNNSNSNKTISRTKNINNSGESLFIDCDITYKELSSLDLKVLEMLRADNNNSLLKEINNKLLFWLRNIRNTCPNLGEFNTLKNYIEDEYTKFIQPR